MRIFIHQYTREMKTEVDVFLWLLAQSSLYWGDPSEQDMINRLRAQWDYWADLDILETKN